MAGGGRARRGERESRMVCRDRDKASQHTAHWPFSLSISDPNLIKRGRVCGQQAGEHGTHEVLGMGSYAIRMIDTGPPSDATRPKPTSSSPHSPPKSKKSPSDIRLRLRPPRRPWRRIFGGRDCNQWRACAGFERVPEEFRVWFIGKNLREA